MAILLTISFSLLGAVLASFGAVIAERLNTGESWAHGRSRCNSCARSLTALDLVPVLSWLLVGGRCRSCKASIPWLYTASEAMLAFLFALSYYMFGLSLGLGLFLASLFLLEIIVLYDLRHTVVPALLSTLFVLVAVVYAYFAAGNLRAFGLSLLVAGLIGIGFFLLYACSKGRAMGLGDAPMAFGLSLLAGTQAISGLLFSFWIGAAVGILILVSRPRAARMGIEVPFVPFMAAGYMLAVFTQWSPFTF